MMMQKTPIGSLVTIFPNRRTMGENPAHGVERGYRPGAVVTGARPMGQVIGTF